MSKEWREWRWQQLTSAEENYFPSGICVCCKHKSPVLLSLPMFIEREWALGDPPRVEFRWVNGGHHEYRVVDTSRGAYAEGLDAFHLVCWFAEEGNRRQEVVRKIAGLPVEERRLYIPCEAQKPLYKWVSNFK